MAPRKALISYSHSDESYRASLEVALSSAVRSGEIEIWSDHKILAGQDLDEAIMSQLQSADLVLLLISPDFVASDYCYKKELQIALERHENKRAVVVPIIVRPTDWGGLHFSKLLMLPYDAKPVSTWSHVDEAWLDVVRGIRRLLQDIPVPRKEHEVFSSKAMGSRLVKSFEALQARFENPEIGNGVPFGIVELDRLSDGISFGELSVLAGFPDHGHIELASNLVTNQVGLKGQKKNRLMVLSQRSSASSLTNRLICALSLVSRARFARGDLGDDDWSRVTGGIRLLKHSDITIDDDPIRSLSGLRNKLIELRDGGFPLVVIDGVEYMNSGGEERGIAIALSDFARTENVAVLVTLTLNMSSDGDYPKRPAMSDMRTWGELGALADKVLLCARDFEPFRLNVPDPRELGWNLHVFMARSSDGAQGGVQLRFHRDSGAVYGEVEVEEGSV